MLEGWKREWRTLKRSRPGDRFQARYERTHRAGGVTRVLRPLLGLAVAGAGVVLMPAPGPGWVVFIVGLSLLASDIWFVARGLDWAEVRGRAAWKALRGFWARSSTGIRVAVAAVSVLVAAGAGWGLWRLMFR